MKTFKVIDQLNIIEGELMCKNPSERSFRKAHYRQGDLDGACGAYCIAMALNILGVFEPEDLNCTDDLDLRYTYSKHIQAFNNQGLYRKGLETTGIFTILDYFAKDVKASSFKKNDILPVLKEYIDMNTPAVLGISFSKDEGHWVLAVGYQIDEKGNLESILTLDPSSNSPICSYWNGLLDLHRIPRKRYAYNYFSDYISIVSIDELVVIERKK